MKKSLKYTSMLLTAMLLFAFSGLRPGGVYGSEGDCSIGTALPAFLGTSIDPNLLLLIDNSASMYDLAYVDAAQYCFDDTYNIASSYAGYFEEDTSGSLSSMVLREDVPDDGTTDIEEDEIPDEENKELKKGSASIDEDLDLDLELDDIFKE